MCRLLTTLYHYAGVGAANRLHTLIVVLGALGELPEPQASESSIADYLPAPAAEPQQALLRAYPREQLPVAFCQPEHIELIYGERR